MTPLPPESPLASSLPSTSILPQTLAQLFGLDESFTLWSAAELASILRHQLAAPLLFDLKREAGFDTVHLQQLAVGANIVTFADLLHHPQPPLELLVATKQFAKSSQHHPEAPLPPQIISVLYFTAIFLAHVRCQSRISTLSHENCLAGINWCVSQPWLDDATRKMLEEYR